MTDHELPLRLAWQRHVTESTEPLERLLARHREKHRRYHTVRHVAWVVRHVGELADEVGLDDDGRSDTTAAAFYHDAVYEPRSPAAANERASARLARRDLTRFGWNQERVERVGTMIEHTAHHRDPADSATAVLFDADLSVLAADPARYADYVRNVRAEYAHVDGLDWVTGRTAVLTSFVERPTIFATQAARDRWETRAQANLRSELAALGGGT
ncbi:MAG: metal-dependent phosphohydrolase [Actinomycetota bacterium]